MTNLHFFVILAMLFIFFNPAQCARIKPAKNRNTTRNRQPNVRSTPLPSHYNTATRRQVLFRQVKDEESVEDFMPTKGVPNNNNNNNFVYSPNVEWRPTSSFDAQNIPPWLANLLSNFLTSSPSNTNTANNYNVTAAAAATAATSPTMSTYYVQPSTVTTKPTVPFLIPLSSLKPTVFTTYSVFSSSSRASTSAFTTGRLTSTILTTTRPATTLSPLQAICGTTKYSGTRNAYILSPFDRIVGGTDTVVNEMPWQARVMSTTSRGTALCGGTIINSRAIITAAHCVVEQGTSVRVVLGDYSIRSYDVGEQTVPVSQIVVHPQYSTSQNNNDFALLLLSRDVTFTEGIRPACLPKNTNDDFNTANCLVSGWGCLSEGNSRLPDSLQKASIRVTPTATCKQIYSRGRITITPQMICASSPGVDTCQGDSGGPMVTTVNGRYTLIGVTSFGIGCGQSFPGVYSRVTAVMPWIETTAGVVGTA